MWLITTMLCAVLATLAYIVLERKTNTGKKYKVHYLALMLWGAALMILVDHTIGYLQEGGDFIEFETDGLVPSATLLGMLMLLPVLGVWAGALGLERLKENKERR